MRVIVALSASALVASAVALLDGGARLQDRDSADRGRLALFILGIGRFQSFGQPTGTEVGDLVTQASTASAEIRNTPAGYSC